MVERKMNLRRLGISLILLSPVFLFFQIWLLFEPNWLNFFGFSHGWTWNSIYYAYLLPSWIFLAVMLSFGLAIYVIETRKISHKRPDGISITAILWLFSGVHSSFISSVTIFSNQAILTSLGVWELEPFLVFRFTFETTLGCLNLFLGVLQILTAYWLWKGRKYSSPSLRRLQTAKGCASRPERTIRTPRLWRASSRYSSRVCSTVLRDSWLCQSSRWTCSMFRIFWSCCSTWSTAREAKILGARTR